MENILVTGSQGFIGLNFVKYLIDKQIGKNIVGVDYLTYAANKPFYNSKYNFIKGDINDKDLIRYLLRQYNVDTVFHFAAETHVDNSITNPERFIHSNINGTHNLLKQCYIKMKRDKNFNKFIHVSTDEVYGSIELDEDRKFTEKTFYQPSSPYSASKAASDHLVYSYYKTFGLPINITHSSNNYGPYQHKEKLIPKIILNTLKGVEVPVYGDGLYSRDWVHVNDHCQGLLDVEKKGINGEVYNIGSGEVVSNIDLINMVFSLIKKTNNINGRKKFVKDRLGHDRKYVIDNSKIKTLGWNQSIPLPDGLSHLVQFYSGKCNDEV